MNVGNNLVFVGRVRELGQQLATMQGRIQALKSSNMRDAERLAHMKESLSGLLGSLMEKFKKFEAVLMEGGGNDWAALKRLNIEFQELARECVACEQSVTLRKQSEGFLLHAADKLVEAFSRAVNDPRSHYVLVSENEHLTPKGAAIHASYNRLEVWHLNRVAHEFGHLWAQGVKNDASGLQQRFINRLTPPAAASSGASSASTRWTDVHAREFFADIVATYVCGPAYASACLSLDFDPAEDESSDSHPSGHDRVHCMLIALECLAPTYASYNEENVHYIRKQLVERWNSARISAGRPIEVSDLIALEYAVDLAVDGLVEKMPNAQFKCLAAAYRVDGALRMNRTNPGANARCVDILNGLWLRRGCVDHSSLSALGKLGLKMFLESSQ
jgi:hypothetical protein